jgi:hypothetical protein
LATHIRSGVTPLEVVGQLRAVLGLADAEGVPCRVVRVPQVIDAAEQGAEHLAIRDDAADGDAAEVDAVVAALAPDEPGARALAARAVVGDRDLERRLDRLRSRVGVEDLGQALGRDLDQPLGQFEGQRVRHVERRGEVEFGRLALDRLDDLRPVVSRVDAPQSGAGIEDLPPVRGPELHARGTGQQPRRLLELAVGSKRHPEGVEVAFHDRVFSGGVRCLGI